LRYYHAMKSKPLTFLYGFTLLIFYSGFSVVFADDFQNGLDAYLEKDYETAYKLFAPLAEQGNAISQFHMGNMYFNGQGVPHDYKKAAKWYRLAAEQEDAISQFNIGEMYSKGQGVPHDYKKAVKWYRLAAEQGLAQGQFNLGEMYFKGTGVPQNHKEAVKWLLKSAEQKSLTIAFKSQRLIRTNYHQWHKKIAEQGDSYAQRFLGASYYLGLGITQDYAEAAKWYKKAAEQEDRVAQNILGAMYEKGKGVSKNFVEAYKWFSLSEETVDGHMYKKKIGKRMTSAQIAKAQQLALEWTEKSQKK